ncbi:MAG TPA: IS66 family transposase [Gammaproteobacteria bacterium]|nr:IS66 family transposase [Gammaproteobacteria bacterium]
MDTQPPLPPDIWDRTPPEARACIVGLAARVAALESTVQELTERLSQDSSTSSRPPSSDPPERKRPHRRRQPSGRRPGGQPGHPGQTRRLMPVTDVDKVRVLKPENCARCAQPLIGDDPLPYRHQVVEIPPLRPVVTEYQLHRLTCLCCGETTQAALPLGVPTGVVGPRAQAVAALCTGADRLSKRTTPRVLEDLFGLSVSLGTLSNLEAATTEAVAAPIEAARTYVQAQSSAHLDETSWREGSQRAWLWVAATTWVTVFLVRLSRGGEVARELLGQTFSGILVTDRWSAYNWYPVRWRQLCWAHLLRDFEAMISRGGKSQEIGEALKSQAHQMFHWWHRVRDGTLSRSSFRSYMSPVRRQVEQLLEAGVTCGVSKTEGMCRDMLKRRQALWTFVHLEGVEPTNNTGERAIRPGVLWRKGSFGTHSPQGSRFVESMMTVVGTLKQQQRNVLDYLTAACEATLRDEPAPSLLPRSRKDPSDPMVV